MCRRLIYFVSFILVLGLVGSGYAQIGKGNILFEYFWGTTDQLSSLLGLASYPDSPDDSEWRTIFEGPTDWRDNYGTRVRGYVYPPGTGDYTFWIASDDQSQLWLSTNDDPANAVQIASVPGWTPSRDFLNTGGGVGGPEQQSGPITLQAGQKYYIEALQAEGGGGDNLAVAWGGPGIGAGPVVIAGTYLSPWIRPTDLMASNPVPADGAMGVTLPMLSWDAGRTAKYHDVYFGTNPTPGLAELVAGMWMLNMYWFGAPGPGLNPGTTYYWKIDEIEIDGSTIHYGDVWSFTAAPYKAYSPSPADGARYISVDGDLSWLPGATAIKHDVYFGTVAPPPLVKADHPDTTYEPGTLAKDTRYFWRIDEKESGGTVYTGDVWNFRTRPEMVPPDPDMEAWYKLDDVGSGTAIDYSGNDRDGTLVGDPEFVPGYYGEGMEFDGDDHVDTGYTENLVNWTITAWVISPAAPSGDAPSGPLHREQNYQFNWNHGDATYRAAAAINTGGTWHAASYGPLEANTWYHLAATYDGNAMRAYRNGVLITTNTAPTGAPSNEGNSLKLGRHAASAQYFTGIVDDARVYSRALTADEIKQTMRGEPDLAWNPIPANGSTPDIEHVKPLIWSPGDKVSKHDVYFGTDPDAVQDADSSDATGVYRGRIDPNSYTPPEALELNQSYYWRIDEYNTDTTISTGRVWSFTVAEYLVVEDFESYDDLNNRIYLTWIDGYGSPSQGIPGNGTGSTVGHLRPPYAEQVIVNEGLQAMPMDYNNVNSPYRSEAVRTFDTPQDWTRRGVKALTLWFRGLPASVGSFNYNPATGIYTMTADGADIWGVSDVWAKAGVMIRESLEPNSPHAFAFITPSGIRAFQNRPTKGEDMVGTWSAQGTITAPHWVRIVRSANSFTAYYSPDGSSWNIMPEENTGADASPNPQTIPMSPDVYVGLALTSHNTGAVCTATFSNVTITGTVIGSWQSQDIGIASNVAEQLYVAVEDSTGKRESVEHPDPNAVLLDTWQQWDIPLTDFSSASVSLPSIKKIYVGVGDLDAPMSGGTGSLYFDDIRLYRPRCMPGVIRPAGDFSNNCVVDYADLDIMTNNWLMTDYDVTPVAPSDANLVAHYRFESDTLDSSGNGNHGDPCGAPAYVPGQVGSALAFDGVDDSVVTNQSLLSGLAEFTLAGWVSAGNPEASRIGLYGQNDCVEFGFDAGNIAVWTAGGGQWVGTEWTFADLTWHHAAVVGDGTDLRIYLDGQLMEAGGTAVSNYGSSSYGFNIGGSGVWDASGNWFSGQIDEVRVYSRALSQAEVGSLAGKTATYTQLLYPLLTPQDPAMDMVSDGTIDLRDYSVLADTWLDELLWPSETAPLSDVEVACVILTAPSSSDTTATLPVSVSSVTAGQDYYVEVWASDVGSANTGLTSVYVDMQLSPCGVATITSIDHGGIFTVFGSGTIGSCGVDELGGSSLTGAGVEPQWARVAAVKIHADASGALCCSLAQSSTGIAAFGRGTVAWADVKLTGSCD